MADNRIPCPYCGESIVSTARKCRFCGEWLTPVESESKEIPESVTPSTSDTLNYQTSYAISQTEGSALNQYIQPEKKAFDNSIQEHGIQSPKQPIINVNIAQQTAVTQEATQIVAVKEKDSKSGFLYFELFCLSAGVWIGSGHWWLGLIAFFGLLILMMIPLLGSAICVLLGLGVGACIGILADEFGAPEWASWFFGLLFALGCIYGNLEGRKEMLEDIDD